MITSSRKFTFLFTYFTCALIILIDSASPAWSLAPKKKSPPAARPAVRAPEADASAPECKASLLMDLASGSVLQETNSHESLPPASMVKIMLSYVTLKKVHDGVVKLTDSVTVSPACSKIGGSQVYLKQGEQFNLGQLLEAVMIESANDAAVAIAEYIGGTKEGFVDIMNTEAKALGMTESEFHSPHGLPPGKGQEPDKVSAHDFSILARTLIKNYPEVLEMTGKAEADFRDGAFKMSNHNHLLRSFAGCDGLKTGYYAQAGFSIAATAKRNNQRLLAIVMGCKERPKRDAEAARLLSVGFAQFRPVNVVGKGTPIDRSVQVSGGEESSIVPVTAADFSAVVKPGDEAKITKQVNACGGLQAPVAPNTPCGTMSFLLGEQELGHVDLIVPHEIREGGMISGIRSKIGW